MELVFKRFARIVAALPAGTGASGVTALDDKAGDQAVENGAVIVSIQAKLEKVAAGERGLLSEELEEDLASGGVEDGFCGRLWLEVVKCAHVGGDGLFEDVVMFSPSQ